MTAEQLLQKVFLIDVPDLLNVRPGPLPLVSVCVPVFNEQDHIRTLIANLIAQDHRPIEIIVVDNDSTDSTGLLARQAAEASPEVTYIRQTSNVGGWNNFMDSLAVAKGEYILWATPDDSLSSNFISSNVGFLEDRHDYVAVTGHETFGEESRTFEISGVTVSSRIREYFRVSWRGNGLFYGVYRQSVLKSLPETLRVTMMGPDWGVLIWALSKGKVGRNPDCSITISNEGQSNSDQKFSLIRTSIISWIRPFYRLEREVLSWRVWDKAEKSQLRQEFAKRNLSTAFAQLAFELKMLLRRNSRELR